MRAARDLSGGGERRVRMRKSAADVQNMVAEQTAKVVALPAESDLQLLFARLNLMHFSGELPAYRIAYNRRLSSVAGRITYKPRLIELSTRLLGPSPGHVQPTLLHEMIHAWLHERRLPSGHGAHFKRKMREVGLSSIYHSLQAQHRTVWRYMLTCPRCRVEVRRRRRPATPVSCARCSPHRFDSRVRMHVQRIAGRRSVQAAN